MTGGRADVGVGGRPVWMVRINPMARQRLADPEMVGLVEQAIALQRAAGALADAASDDLYRLVPGSSEEVRGRLLALRRDIHNGRGRGQAAEELPIDLPASVAQWSDNHRQRLACHDQVRRTHADALSRERSMLRERLGEGNFLTTLAQSASGVYDAACRYRRHGTVDSKDRKAERALVQFMTRAMVRTSPYGRFTAVGLAEPDPAGTAMDVVTAGTASPQVELDRALFDYVIGGLLPAEPDPLVTVPLTARVGDDRVTFFQVGQDVLRRLSAPLNRQTKVLVDLLALGPRRRSALADDVAERMGLDLAAADRLVGIALGLGLLVTAWRGDEFVAEPVDRAMHDLAAAKPDRAPDALHQLRAGLDRLGGVGSGGRGEGARGGDARGGGEGARGGDARGGGEDLGIDERIALSRRLETVGDELSRLACRPARLTVNEDYVLDPLLVDPGTHRQALDDLAAVTELFWTFDRMHVVRALAAATIVERFGPGCQVPLVEHAESLVRAVYRAERTLAEDPDAAVGPPDRSLAMLAKVRREALSALQRDLAGTGELQWSPADVTALVAAVPDRFRVDPASYGLVVQPLGDDLVVNDTYAGHGPMFSRFLHADQVRGGDATGRLRARLQNVYGPGARLLEDRGHHSLSINAHPAILDQHLGPDGWRALRLAHDVSTDAVSIVDADGNPVKVLALGAQLPELFPYPVRLATWLCSSGRVVLDVTGRLHQRDLATGSGADRPGAATRAGADRPGATGRAGTVGYRRLRVGRVVVARRRWYPGDDLPVRSGSPDDVDYLLALTRWRADHDIPAEVMLKSVFDGPTFWESLSGAESREQFFELRSRSKPQYVDLASALMTRVLPRLIERRPDGCIEEALPTLADGGHALEWMVEMARPSGAPHFGWDTAPGAAT